MNRYWTRRLTRHGLLALASAVSVAGMAVLSPRTDAVWKLSISSGWVGLVFLALTLVLGPLNVLRTRPNPVSFDRRRDVGIWAAVMAVAHTGIGLFVHNRGRPWTYFLWLRGGHDRMPLRYDVFGSANWSGLAAVVLAATLGAISNDWALRRLGTDRWKSVQRLNYVLFGLVALHGVLFQVVEHRVLGVRMSLVGIVVATVVVQLWGLRVARRRAC